MNPTDGDLPGTPVDEPHSTVSSVNIGQYITSEKNKKLPLMLPRQIVSRYLNDWDKYTFQGRYTRQRNKAMFATAHLAGLRKTELTNLLFTDVDITKRTITVNNSDSGKTRIIAMSDELTESLRAYIAVRDGVGKSCPEFFACRNANSGFTVNSLKHVASQIRKASGLNITADHL